MPVPHLPPMPNAVVVGLQWGDEGKGKVVDLLAPHTRYVVRFQGGNNAGHTLVVQGRRRVFHLVPSGVLHDGVTGVIGPGVVLDPEMLLQEIDLLEAEGIDLSPHRLVVSPMAHVLLPYHRALDRAREDASARHRIGTTQKGIGPAYEDKAARRGVRVVDFVDPGALAARLDAVLPQRNRSLSAYGHEGFERRALLDWAGRLADRLRPRVADTTSLLYRAIRNGEPILFEGAQGTLLDVDHGTYPFVTSSNTVAGAAAAGSGVGPGVLQAVIGIAKAYTTRVGEGPFPTELGGEEGECLRQRGHEFGATTGRPRRCGWLDLALLRYAMALNGATHLAITKLDVLSGLDRLRVCTGYEGVEGIPSSPAEFAAARPIYEDLPGWAEDLSSCRRWADLPSTCRAYVERIEEFVGVRAGLLGVGPGRDENVLRPEHFPFVR